MLQVVKWKNQQHIEGHGCWNIFGVIHVMKIMCTKNNLVKNLYIDVHIDLRINTNAFKGITHKWEFLNWPKLDFTYTCKDIT
jgi:hypothetical protein